MQDLLNRLNESNNFEKFEIYKSILDKCLSNNDSKIYYYFEDFITFLDEFLQHEKNLKIEVKKHVSHSFEVLFHFIKDSKDLDSYEKYRMSFDKYKFLVLKNFLLATIYQYFGYLMLLKQNTQKSMEYLTESLEIADKHCSVDERAILSTNLNYIFESTALLEKAEPELITVSLGNLVKYFNSIENYKTVERNLLIYKKYLENTNELEQISWCQLKLASLYKTTDKLEESILMYEQALKSIEKTKKITKIQVINNALAFVLRASGEYRKSIKRAEIALKISKQQNNLSKVISLLKLIASNHEDLNNYIKAITTYKEVVKYSDELLKTKTKENELTNNPLDTFNDMKKFSFTERNSFISKELTKKISTSLIGKDPKMQELINRVILAAISSSSCILIKGESGTGKEIIAKLIHYSSPRANEPFIAINSASLSHGATHSTLFGHKKGSFTGALSDKIGYFEAANNGTLFMDEIGEMSHEIQIALLRVLEEKEVIPIGANSPTAVDFRMISATNIDVDEHVKTGKLRLDFFNRINTFEIEVPPLRERKEDIPILVEAFQEEICTKLGIKKAKFSLSAQKLLYNYEYPGNVRELKNIIEKLVVYNKKSEITADDISDIKATSSKEPSVRLIFSSLNLEFLEKQAVVKAMEEANNIKTEAARMLGITSTSLHRRLKKYEINS